MSLATTIQTMTMRFSVVFGVLIAVATSAYGAVTPPLPLERFDMLCVPGKPVEAVHGTGSFLGALLPKHGDAFACSATGIGVHPTLEGFETVSLDKLPIMTSENGVGKLKNHLVASQATGITVEAWITPPLNTSAPDGSSLWPWNLPGLPVLTVGMPTREASASRFDKCGAFEPFPGGYDMQLVTHGPKAAVVFEETHTCRRSVTSPDLSGLTHIVWSQSASDLQLFVDGQKIIHTRNSRFEPQLAEWDSSYALHLFSEWSQTRAYANGPHRFFPGTIHSVSIYDSPLREPQVVAAYESGNARIRGIIEKSIRDYMIATPWNNVTLEQDGTEFGALPLGADETVPDDWITYVEIMSEPTRGKLLPLNPDGESITVGSRLMVKLGEARTSLRYKSDTNEFFTVPNKRANGDLLEELPAPDSFSFRLVAVDRETNEVLGVTEPATQMVNIRNVNHAPTWKAPYTVNQTAPTVDEPLPATAIEGIDLVDKDWNVNWVRVTVSGVNGTVQLDPQYEYLARTCPLNLDRAWQCQGMGVEDKLLTFLAEPDNVKLILENLLFRPYYQQSVGMVVLDAYDGINRYDGFSGECMDVAEQTYVVLPDHDTVVSSVNRECFHAQYNIYINTGPELEEILFLQKKFLGIGYAAWIRYAVYAVAFCLVVSVARCVFDCCACLCCGRRGARSGAEVGVDDP